MNTFKYFYILCFLSFNYISFSQTKKINSSIIGMVVDSNQYAIPYSTIQLLNNDSVTKYGAMCDSIGFYKIDSVEKGNYILKISSVGYKTHIEKIDVNNENTKMIINPIALHPDIQQLETIKINANKTGFTTYVDKTEFYPDSLTLKSSKNALDLIQKVPEIKVDKRHDEIKVLGSSNVLVLINGVQNNRVLKSITPDEIEKVEVITHPSAKYRSDIASVVNIVLKDKRKQGVSIYSDFSMCLHQKNHMAFTQISYNLKKWRFFLNYNAFLSKTIDKDSTVRTENINKYLTYPLENNIFDWNSHTFQYGFDFFPNKTFVINFTGKIDIRKITSDEFGKTLYIKNDTNLIDENLFKQHSDNTNIQQNYSLYLKKDFNKKNTIHQTTNIYFLNNTILSDIENTNMLPIENIYSTQILSDMQQFSINSKIDYTHTFNKKINLETGYQLYSRQINTKVNDQNTTSLLKYIDFRNSLYTNSIYKFNNNGIQTGIRIENLNIALYDTVKNNYTKILPFLSFNHKFNSAKSIRFSYNQRLNYPNYYQLNPYVYFSADSVSLNAGNPNLLPELSQNISSIFSYNKKNLNYSVLLGYNKIKNIIVETLQSSNGIISSKYNNMGKADMFKFNFNLSSTIFNYLDIQLSFVSSYTFFKDRKDYNGLSYNTEIEFYIPLFWDIDFDASIILYNKNINYNGYETENFMIDELALSKYILDDYFIVGFSVWEPLFKSTGEEIRMTDKYYEKNTYQVINSTCYMFNLTFILNKGRKSKKIKAELNMEDNKIP